MATLCFNPRARVGRDLKQSMLVFVKYMFQSTRPRGARLFVSRHCHLQNMFQSTRPRGARLIPVLQSFAPYVFQSTRPRGARPNRFLSVICSDPVSIHAPAWGATACADELDALGVVSIHAPAWGATFTQQDG